MLVGREAPAAIFPRVAAFLREVSGPATPV